MSFYRRISMYDDDTDFEAELRALLADGRKIEAIKRYREQTGAGLAAAKEAVEALEQGGSLPTIVPLDSSIETEIASLLESGQKIQAIKLYRERTGAGLKEAKDAVDAMGRGEKVVVQFREIDQDLESELIGLLQQGQKIQAIKLCRSRTGMGLKEAKEVVEALAEKHGLIVATGGGCLGATILVLLLIVTGVGLSNEPQVATNSYTNPVGEAPIHMSDPSGHSSTHRVHRP
jgi:ribosomal protein L7/L12